MTLLRPFLRPAAYTHAVLVPVASVSVWRAAWCPVWAARLPRAAVVRLAIDMMRTAPASSVLELLYGADGKNCAEFELLRV